MNKKQLLIQNLKQKFPNDYLVLYDKFDIFKFWVFGSYADAKKHYNRINDSWLMDDLPCSLQITTLF